MTFLTGKHIDRRALLKGAGSMIALPLLDAMRLPRRDVFVPREVGAIHKATYVLPLRAQEGVARALKSDKILQDIDHGQRAGYENRAAHSEPGLEPEAAEPVETS